MFVLSFCGKNLLYFENWLSILASCLFLLQVVEVNVKVEEPGQNNIHNNAFYAEEQVLKSELKAMRDCDPSVARHWIVRVLGLYDKILLYCIVLDA